MILTECSSIWMICKMFLSIQDTQDTSFLRLCKDIQVNKFWPTWQNKIGFFASYQTYTLEKYTGLPLLFKTWQHTYITLLAVKPKTCIVHVVRILISFDLGHLFSLSICLADSGLEHLPLLFSTLDCDNIHADETSENNSIQQTSTEMKPHCYHHKQIN